MKPDLLAWLSTAMDAAQRDAEAATPGPWYAHEYTWDAGDFEASIGTDESWSPSSWGDADIVGGGREGGGVVKLVDARHIARHDPSTVLRRIAADRKLIADLRAETHVVAEDPWFSCAAATPERDDGCSEAGRWGKPCDCGLDERVERRLRIIAEGYGWTETA